ncbi:glycerophosphodiester phosphodiesterase family protein [Rathayibacter sp. YIM 133350]|uniref:glycerophosphodiester phosphodiesterase family protein n=1 Tax=Rathayibacter sp. YIM 133350 TaxID=3131992 RepID=UPI00307E8842
MASASHPLVIGHRGAPGYRPEHTAASYRLAIALGADAVEPDIVATRDGVLVVRHENEISGTTDVARHPEFVRRRTTKVVDGRPLTGWFTEDFTWAELSTLGARERIPKTRPANATFDSRYPLLRLSDLFELLERSADAGTPVGMVAEIKHPSYFAGIGLPLDELFAAEVAAAGWQARDERLTLECFELGVLHDLANRAVGARRVFLLEKSGTPYDEVLARGAGARPYADFLTKDGLRSLAESVDGISVDKALLLSTDAAGEPAGDALVGSAHANGLLVFTWTLRPENRFLAPAFRQGKPKGAYGDWLGEFELVLSTGVDGVFADHPDLAVEARSALSN